MGGIVGGVSGKSVLRASVKCNRLSRKFRIFNKDFD